MADVYVLASPAPTLYVYPSALHSGVEPPAPIRVRGGRFYEWTPGEPLSPNQDADTINALLGVI